MADPMTPKEVKVEVRKELAKSDFSWIRKDWVVVGTLFLILSILSVVQILGLREATDAAKAAQDAAGFGKLLEECQTPGTACYEFSEAQDEEQRVYFVSLLKTTGICTLITSGAVNNDVIPFTDQAMIDHYNACVDARTGPPPDPAGTPVNPPPPEKR